MKMGQIYKGIRAAGTAKHAKKKQLHGSASYAEAEAKKTAERAQGFPRRRITGAEGRRPGNRKGRQTGGRNRLQEQKRKWA